ncbi:hypothetical protein AB0284_21430 [Pseudarthrobacter phenanthrenivorans]|uniref:hypothetical protein n=1 Tax=Pseudarthrobacter phenanthrenivorans TaxID=361575 RepID=UPI00344D9AE7
MNTQRDELADEITGWQVSDGYYGQTIPSDVAREIADHLTELGYRKPRTVTTAAELDALPVGSVILDADQGPWQKVAPTYWAFPDSTSWYGSQHIAENDFLPATVLHEGEK